MNAGAVIWQHVLIDSIDCDTCSFVQVQTLDSRHSCGTSDFGNSWQQTDGCSNTWCLLWMYGDITIIVINSFSESVVEVHEKHH